MVLLAMRILPPPMAGEAIFQKPARCELSYQACASTCISGVRVRTRLAGTAMPSQHDVQNLLLK